MRITAAFISMFMSRAILLVKYFMMFEEIRVIVHTASRLAMPFLGILFCFYLITYEYLVVGQLVFGGKITFSDGPVEGDTVGTGLDLY